MKRSAPSDPDAYTVHTEVIDLDLKNDFSGRENRSINGDGDGDVTFGGTKHKPI